MVTYKDVSHLEFLSIFEINTNQLIFIILDVDIAVEEGDAAGKENGIENGAKSQENGGKAIEIGAE